MLADVLEALVARLGVETLELASELPADEEDA